MVSVALYREIMRSVIHRTFLESRIVRQVVGLVYGVYCDVLAFSKLFGWIPSQVGGYGKLFWRSGPLLTIWNACTDCLRGLQQ